MLAPHHSTPASNNQNGIIQNLQRDLQLNQISHHHSAYPSSPPQPPLPRATTHQPISSQVNKPINVNPQNTQSIRHNDQMPEIRKYKKVFIYFTLTI